MSASLPCGAKEKPDTPLLMLVMLNNSLFVSVGWSDVFHLLTSFLIIATGMRQLNDTGYMHHRVRIIVACFLAKDLMVHWQKGEKYFMHNLIDGDFAPNNGGWQWVIIVILRTEFF